MNPTSKKNIANQTREEILNTIVSTIQSKRQNEYPAAYRTVNSIGSHNSNSPSPTRTKLSYEQKRLKRNVLKVIEMDDGKLSSKLKVKLGTKLP